jgi:WhiB family redox-sensing transcriptional regulator
MSVLGLTFVNHTPVIQRRYFKKLIVTRKKIALASRDDFWVEEEIAVVDTRQAQGVVLGLVPLSDVEELAWQEQALCAQTDPEAFFPEKGGSTREAKKVCLSCEVRVDCLEYALEQDERFGIWGGLSERERRRLKKLAVS